MANATAIAPEPVFDLAKGGDYRFDRVPVGTYQITARKNDYFDDSVAGVLVTADAVGTVEELRLAPKTGDFQILSTEPGGSLFEISQPA